MQSRVWKNHHCPSCNRMLYSRAHACCGWCGAALPEDCRMEGDRIDEMKEEIRAIQSGRLKAREEEEKLAASQGQ